MTRKKLTRLSFKSCWLFFIFFLSSCTSIEKVKIDYRHAPLIENIKDKQFIIGAFITHVESFSSNQDIETSIESQLKKDEVFSKVTKASKQTSLFKTEDEFHEFIKAVPTYDFNSFNQQNPGDLMMIGEIWFNSQSHSGYDTSWRTNRYGYRVPTRVWVDKSSFDYKVRFVLIDLQKRLIVLDKEYQDRADIEGVADEIAVFIDMTQFQVKKFLDIIQGKQIAAKRYLIRN